MREIYTDFHFNGGATLKGLPDPTASTDAATKNYVDAQVEGLAWKDNVRVAAQVNVNIASPGATIDSISLNAGDRVLLFNQTAQAENGIYIWNGAAVAMSRSADSSTSAELTNATVTVDSGTSAGATYRQSTVNPVIGTNNIVFGTFGTAAPSASTTQAGIVELADQTETDAGTDNTRALTPQGLGNWAGRKRKFTGTLGDGSATQIDATHNFGTRDVHVAVYRNSSPWDDIFCDVSRPDANTVRFNFSSAPTAAQFAFVILG